MQNLWRLDENGGRKINSAHLFQEYIIESTLISGSPQDLQAMSQQHKSSDVNIKAEMQFFYVHKHIYIFLSTLRNRTSYTESQKKSTVVSLVILLIE